MLMKKVFCYFFHNSLNMSLETMLVTSDTNMRIIQSKKKKKKSVRFDCRN